MLSYKSVKYPLTQLDHPVTPAACTGVVLIGHVV